MPKSSEIKNVPLLNKIDRLVELCKKQPFDTSEIDTFIKSNGMSSEEVTRAALKLCEYGMFSYSDYISMHEKEPVHGELRTYKWEEIFNVLVENGLDAELIVCDNGRSYKNILQEISYFDDGDLSARVLRNILSKGGNPNIKINGEDFFEEKDGNLIIDIEMDMYHHKWQLDNAVRFWLVLVGFGGTIHGGKSPVNMRGGRSVKIFKEFERFDYDIVFMKNDYEIRIIEKETKEIVATV